MENWDSRMLGELYSSILIRLRRIAALEEKKETRCTRCGCSLSDHLGDDRCSSYALSGNFHSEHAEESKHLSAAVKSIEELREIEREYKKKVYRQ